MDKKTKRVVTVMMILLAIGAGFAISKIVKANKELSVEVKTEGDRTRYIGANGMSFYSMVDTPNAIYTLIDTEGDTDAYKIAKAVYAIDKQTGKMEIVPGSRKMKYGYDGIDSTFGNEHYLGWVEADTDYTTRTVIYDIEQEKILKKWNGSDAYSFSDFHVIGHRVYWLESSGKTGLVMSYDLKTAEEEQLDEVGAEGTVLAFSEHKMWYRDIRRGSGHLKSYDLRSGNYEIHDLGVDYSDLKPVGDNLVAYSKENGLYLYDTKLQKTMLLNGKDNGIKANYDGKGLIVTDQMSYKIERLDGIRYSNTIGSEYPDNHLFSTAERIQSLLFITKVGEHEEIIRMNQDALRWSEK
ncbi:hypothetical protein PWEIH_06521 [Listeria weihenstephanensis FSL R9-0317]|uniref:Uncharacterized protein n=1 Tax=Listeria weihenstephanensis TaxID=1006155 RepID=A0A1S7FRC4_9LIST|nr:hypothetical protein [Listeria weihenstephanensis]AQY49942.1 hypothetical protein UE46_02000 [Listeria weihenstephanensis]EUJ39720.1 hypothetical protein PWEIH_06521 [Listeria weihenstephanensis FSL R9-0317]